MSLAALHNTLGQTVIPTIAAAVFPDTCTITAETTNIVGGEQVKSGTTNAYSNVPCAYEPKQGTRLNSADKLVSVNTYILTLPTHQSGTRINLGTTTHKIVVNARGNEPAKTFRVISIADDAGVVYSVECEKED